MRLSNFDIGHEWKIAFSYEMAQHDIEMSF
jgi:hypothetical protein